MLQEMDRTKAFANLLKGYCDEKTIADFQSHLRDNPVSSLILNRKFLSEEELLSSLPEVKKDEKDNLLFRFHKDESRVGKTLEHFGGGFYILDPSSALISYYLKDLLPKDFLSIDLCSAPGGKTIALDLRRPDGLYLAGDISYERAIEIGRNSERLGLDNILTYSLDPMKLNLDPIFDLVILDVPCSGSGMIRKEPKMAQDWSQEKVNRLLPIQAALLEKAYTLIGKDGIIAYSTCSLSIEEDEEQVSSFMKKHPDMELINADTDRTVIKGKKNIGYHLIPGIYDGEGIYFALLRKNSGAKRKPTEIKYKKKSPIEGKKVFTYRKNDFLLPRMYDELDSLPFITPGLRMNDISEHPKCEFDHSYAKISDVLPFIQLSYDQALAYVSGNEATCDKSNKDGVSIIRYNNLVLGLGKNVKGRVKNYLPKGLRTDLIKR